MIQKITAILQKGWILSIGGASSGRVCACSLRSRLVLIVILNNYIYNYLFTSWIFFFIRPLSVAIDRKDLHVLYFSFLYSQYISYSSEPYSQFGILKFLFIFGRERSFIFLELLWWSCTMKRRKIAKGFPEYISRVSKSCNYATTWFRKIIENLRKFLTKVRKTGKNGTNFMYLSQFNKVFLVSHVFFNVFCNSCFCAKCTISAFWLCKRIRS